MIHFITYSNDLYGETRDYCATMAKRRGKVDTVTVYEPKDIDSEFFDHNKSILKQKAGNGLWLWKPYFVCKKLSEVNEGDIVLYCDAGSFFFRNCKAIINSMTDDIWVSDIPLIEKQFTKPELLELMGCNDVCFTETNQVQANFIAIRKTARGLKFSVEWLYWCCRENALTKDTIYKNVPLAYQFYGHRSDQSVLSLLTKKWNIKTHQDPTQYGRVPEKYYSPGRIYRQSENMGEYKCCIILHRGKKAEFKTCLMQWLCTWLPLPFIYAASKPCKEVAKMRGKLL